jgi:hypothetical protein
MKVPALPLAIASIALALITTSLTAKPGPVAAATTKQSTPVLLKATVTNSQVGCKLVSPVTSTVYYQKNQSVSVSPSAWTFQVDANQNVTPSPSVTYVEVQCSPGFTVTGTLTNTSVQFGPLFGTGETFIGSTTSYAPPTSLDCGSFPKNPVGSGTAPQTGNATPNVYLWYGACVIKDKNKWQAGTYTISDSITVTFN